MIDEKILDEILPIPDINELKEEVVEELLESGFAVTNFNSGGVFNHLLMMVLKIRIDFVKVCRNMLNNMFVNYSEGVWLELKGGDYSKTLKLATKTRGYVTLTRGGNLEALKIPRGHIFKTDTDLYGKSLKFVVIDDVIFEKGKVTIKVLVEAEFEGAAYNVAPGQIKHTLTHIEGVQTIKNDVGWIVKEGADIEDEESFRGRVLNSWADLSSYPIRQKYKNKAESVAGVLFAEVDDNHPRGQGTVDIIITSTAGTATAMLIKEVEDAIEGIRGPYDNVLVKSSETINQNIELILYSDAAATAEELVKKAEMAITEFFKMNSMREFTRLYRDDITYLIKDKIPECRKVDIVLPKEDLIVSNHNVIVLGELSITAKRV